MARNHYEVLGLERGSSHSEIRSAYRRLVIRYHPDTSKETNALEQFHRITEAYEVLGDRERRLQYDKLLDMAATQAVVQTQRRRSPEVEATKAKAYAAAPGGRRAAAVSTELTRLTLLHSRGQSALAEKLANKILGYDPKQPIPYAVLGDIARAKGDLRTAAKMYAYAAQMDPSNELYHQRHEEMLGFALVNVGRTKERDLRPIVVGAFMLLLAMMYLVVARERPLLPELGPVSTWTMGVWVMGFVSGIVIGASMTYAGWLDRFFSIATTALGRISPVVALGTIAIVNFWLAAAIYTLLGLAQNAFNYSTTRVVGAVGTMTFVFAGACALSGTIDATQVFAWGGNLIYMGALCGWMVADSMRNA